MFSFFIMDDREILSQKVYKVIGNVEKYVIFIEVFFLKVQDNVIGKQKIFMFVKIVDSNY